MDENKYFNFKQRSKDLQYYLAHSDYEVDIKPIEITTEFANYPKKEITVFPAFEVIQDSFVRLSNLEEMTRISQSRKIQCLVAW